MKERESPPGDAVCASDLIIGIRSRGSQNKLPNASNEALKALWHSYLLSMG
jgi:hypothetical protein